MSSVPIVDFRPFLHGSREDRKAVAAQIDAAFQTFGFLYLTNHGIPQENVDECFEWVRPSLGPVQLCPMNQLPLAACFASSFVVVCSPALLPVADECFDLIKLVRHTPCRVPAFSVCPPP
jgi:non-haem dioxygenase in morphine synthesis N-terminal